MMNVPNIPFVAMVHVVEECHLVFENDTDLLVHLNHPYEFDSFPFQYDNRITLYCSRTTQMITYIGVK